MMLPGDGCRSEPFSIVAWVCVSIRSVRFVDMVHVRLMVHKTASEWANDLISSASNVVGSVFAKASGLGSPLT